MLGMKRGSPRRAASFHIHQVISPAPPPKSCFIIKNGKILGKEEQDHELFTLVQAQYLGYVVYFVREI